MAPICGILQKAVFTFLLLRYVDLFRISVHKTWQQLLTGLR